MLAQTQNKDMSVKWLAYAVAIFPTGQRHSFLLKSVFDDVLVQMSWFAMPLTAQGVMWTIFYKKLTIKRVIIAVSLLSSFVGVRGH